MRCQRLQQAGLTSKYSFRPSARDDEKQGINGEPKVFHITHCQARVNSERIQVHFTLRSCMPPACACLQSPLEINSGFFVDHQQVEHISKYSCCLCWCDTVLSGCLLCS